MRRQDQLSLTRPPIDHPHAEELEQISGILFQNPRMAELVGQDLVRGVAQPHTGARGLSGDQVLRALLVKQMTGFSYEELAFHLADSVTYRGFCGFGALETTPSRSALAANIKKVRPETLEAIQRLVVRFAVAAGIEKGDKVRIDATVTETNIHAPTDSALLFDGVRVATRLLADAQRLCGFAAWSDHTRRAKRRMLAIHNARNGEERVGEYRDLLWVMYACMRYAAAATTHLRAVVGDLRCQALAVADRIDELVIWTTAVVDQTERRVLRGENVPAEEKVVSLFETHTDIIIKDRRETLYGHKLYLAAGASGLITDCVITRGNPADSTMTVPMLKRQVEILGRTPRQAAFDGAFASRDNLISAKELGIADVAFAKKRGLAISEMTRSTWVYRCLRNFRAGIEGLISFLKRALGLDRCTWKGEDSFACYALASVITGNLLTLARHLLA
jgi:IS5 family transposase